jgi:hypothetical protein
MRMPKRQHLDDCFAPGIWTLRSDGTQLRAIVARAPKALSRLGYYGLQPLAWLGGSALLVGLRTEWGNEAATIDIATKRLRPFGRYSRTGSYYVDKASRDGQLALGAGGNEKVTISIIRVSDGHPLFTLRGYVCCPDWNR